MSPKTLPKPPNAGFGRAGRLLAVAGLAAVTAGCMTSRIQQERIASTGIDAGDSLVILARSYHTGNSTEEDFVDCVSKRLQKQHRELKIYDDDQFLDDFYPWFEPRTEPTSTKELPDLLQTKAVSTALAQAGIRYIVWLEGETDYRDGGGGISCAVGPGALGCFGLTWYEEGAVYEASVWDLRSLRSAGRVATDINGMSMIPALVIPVPLVAPTQTTACKRLADQLTVFIDDEAVSGP
jgi:hypothetical protein